ncbi:primosome assembly protein PriA [Corynebacterium sp. 13CS0277]|uniref:primosomal protein N' n=1 Tax=Corynebacterium sp. 13CS0277 TaxID=2071994 RepID=UPI000D034BC1|nr:primosomal protein N' [Corynebacterium sp. 13CS0277]PRQ11936.1 primosome assembly protein PriA [Corynebacterium sp. 13CS0277]
MPPVRIPAPSLPVARVLPLLPLAHLDRAFDYQVQEEFHELVQPGVRVRIFFHGRRVDGIVLARLAESDFTGTLSWIDKVVSPEVVLPPGQMEMVESVAARYAGTRADVIRLAVPPRHAGAEKTDTTTPWEELGTATEPDLSGWLTYRFGESFVDAVLAGQAARAVWNWIPHDHHEEALAALAVKVALEGGGVLIVVPDQSDLDTVVDHLAEWVSKKQICGYAASDGPQKRYRQFLSMLHGQARIVVGTRSAMYAPVRNLRLCVLLDDGNDNLVDRMAPYPHAREVLAMRSAQHGAAFLVGGYARTAEAQLLVESGWAHALTAPLEVLRERMPRIRAAGDSDFELARDPMAHRARIPGQAFAAMRAALQQGRPVLVQVPRAGYMPSLRCTDCGTPARCRHCHGPLSIPTQGATSAREDRSQAAQAQVPTCRWCGRPDGHYRCPECGGRRLRPQTIGAERTAEELGRAFPQVPVVTSSGTNLKKTITAGAKIVIATPGAEPRVVPGAGTATAAAPAAAAAPTAAATDAPQPAADPAEASTAAEVPTAAEQQAAGAGVPAAPEATPAPLSDVVQHSYGAAVLLDTWALLGLQDLRATERALQRWMDAAALVAPHGHGGTVVITGDPGLRAIQFLIRFDAPAAAAAELASRRDTELPPSVSMAAIDAPAQSLENLERLLDLPPGAMILGPTDLPLGSKLPGEYNERRFGPPQRLLVRAPIAQRAALAAALKHAVQQRAALKEELPLRVQVNPIEFG